METKITAIGNSLGIILSKEMLTRLRLGKGDRLYVSESPQGLILQPYTETIAAQMEVAELVMREDREVLKKLAE